MLARPLNHRYVQQYAASLDEENNLALGPSPLRLDKQAEVCLRIVADLEYNGCVKHPSVDIPLAQMLLVAGIEVLLAVSWGLDAKDLYLARRDLGHGTLSSLTS